ncbi:hypothetical protein K501DRAFT_289261 [Backusella circina FSU 941]|nr:hypothetical protein K501DRAFT_289261 [Backusella circina FSU 941]
MEPPSRNSDVKETLEILTEMAGLLNTGLDRDVLALCVSLCERGVNPEALATVIKDLKKQELVGSSSTAE